MDLNTTYTKTSRGLRALIKKLPRNAGLALSEIDGDSTAEKILSNLKSLNEESLEAAISWLLEGGFIKAIVKDPFSDSVWEDASTHGAVQVDEIGLDQFTISEPKPISITKTVPQKKQVKRKLNDEDKVKIKALEQADIEAHERAEAALKAKLNAENESMSAKERRGVKEKARLEALAKAKEEERLKAEKEAKEKAKKEAAAKKQAEAEEKAAREKREREAEKAKLEALAIAKEKERLKAEKEAKEKAKKEAAAKKQAEAEERKQLKADAKKQAELKAAEKKEEKARIKAEKKSAIKVAAEKKALEKEAAKLEAAERKEESAKEKVELYLHHDNEEKAPHRKVNLIAPLKKGLSRLAKSIRPLSIYAIAVLALLIIAAQFINFHIWINPIEKAAEKNIKENVSIKSVRISFFPSPHLLLEGLTVAGSTTITAEKARIYPNLLNLKEKLFDASKSPYEVKSIDLENFKVAQKDLQRISSWKGASSRDQQLKINKISLKNMSIHLNDMELPSFNGDITLDADGHLTKANITTENQNLTAIIKQTNDKYFIDIEASRWRSPLSPYPIFTKLSAHAVINDNVLAFSRIAGVLYNGSLDANIKIDLASETLDSKGAFTLNNFFIASMAEKLKLNTVIDGKVSAKGDFSFKISKPLNNIFNVKLTSTFNIKNGHLKTVDLVEAMRNGNLNGYTKFTNLSGRASLSNETYRFTRLLLREGQLSARGQLKLTPKLYVSGTISPTIAIKENRIRSRLNINGPLTALKIKP